MEIEKINDNQIKFMISKADLLERDIKISELAYNSDKTRKLFQEMMDKAMDEYDFNVDDTPLMIEAIPASHELVVIIVTKVTDPAEIENRFNHFSDESSNDIFSISDEIKSRVDEYIDKRINETNKSKNKSPKRFKNGDYILIYSFDTLDLIADVSKIIVEKFDGNSSIHKYNDRFYLLIENKKNEFSNGKLFESTLSEYGLKHKATFISKNFLLEHGEKIINDNAVEIFSEYL